MQFKHSNRAVSVSFDDPNLVSSAGIVPPRVHFWHVTRWESIKPS